MLKLRIISGLILAPPVLAAIWWGGLAFGLLAAVAAALMVWEWETVSGGRFGPLGWLVAAAIVPATIMAMTDVHVAILILLCAAAFLGLIGFAGGARNGSAWRMVGLLYVGLPSVGLVWLRFQPEIGRSLVVWLFLLVWATDIGAYAFGRTIGGPLLAPSISPNKTWAGLLGGMICAGLVGVVLASLFEPTRTGYISVLSVILAVVAQLGDLAESRFKRRFGVKDTSAIIPGHGGVLDRLDGLLAAALALAALVYVQGGAGGS